jgi:hypothetical protein
MADKKIKVQVDIETNTEASIAGLKELRKQLKQTAVGTAEFKQLSAQIRDMEDAIEGAKLGAEDLAGALEAAPGPVGQLFQGLKKVEIATKSWGAALKATGIGLIVSLVGGLVAAFTQTEGSMKKLEPLLIGMEKIFGGIVEVMQPLLDIFLEMALKALPYITSGIGKVYSGFVAFFTLISQAGQGVGKIIKGIFTLDTDSITAGYEQLKGSWGKTVEAYDAGVQRFETGTKKLTKTQKENLKTQKEDADKALQEKIKRLEAEDKLDEARLAKLKAEAMQEAFSDEQKLYVEEEFYKKSYDLKLKDIEDKQKLYNKESLEFKALEAEKINLQAENIEKTKEFGEKAIQLAKERGDKITEFEVKLAADLQKIEDDKLAKKLKGYEDDILLLTAQQRTLMEGTKAFLANSLAIEDAAYKLKLENAKGNATRIQAIETEHEQNIKDIKLKAFIAEKQIQLDRLAVISSIGSSLAQLAGKNKALAIAAIAIEKAAAIGQIWTNNSIANAKATAASPLTLGQPWVTINTISAALGTAAAIASAVKAVQQINAVQIPGGGGGAVGSVGGGGAPSLPKINSAAPPQIQTSGGMNPTQQIGETIAGAQKPIKAYVVSGDISSQMALDRRTNRAATFAGG